MKRTSEFKYARCEHCKEKFDSVSSVIQHLTTKHEIQRHHVRSKTDYISHYGPPRKPKREHPGTNLRHVLCQRCKCKFATYDEVFEHLKAAHNLQRSEIRAKKDYKGSYRPISRTTNKNRAANNKGEPVGTAPQQQTNTHPTAPGMTELVIPVYIKIPLMIGQAIIIDPTQERS